MVHCLSINLLFLIRKVVCSLVSSQAVILKLGTMGFLASLLGAPPGEDQQWQSSFPYKTTSLPSIKFGRLGWMELGQNLADSGWPIRHRIANFSDTISKGLLASHSFTDCTNKTQACWQPHTAYWKPSWAIISPHYFSPSSVSCVLCLLLPSHWSKTKWPIPVTTLIPLILVTFASGLFLYFIFVDTASFQIRVLNVFFPKASALEMRL